MFIEIQRLIKVRGEREDRRRVSEGSGKWEGNFEPGKDPLGHKLGILKALDGWREAESLARLRSEELMMMLEVLEWEELSSCSLY